MSSIACSDRWLVDSYDPVIASRIQAACGVAPLVARIMAARGISGPAEAMEFLHPSLDRDWNDPTCIPGLAEACDRLQLAGERGEHVAIFGDFDVDGISATCLMTLGLRDLGYQVTPLIPRRFEEGYGLSPAALSRLYQKCRPDLIVTVDTGIAGAAEVAELLAEGIDVVITDHHEPGDLVPRDVPVCDPKLSPDCPSRELAGVGVALKVICELGRRMGKPNLWRSYTDIATLGTVSDMMLLTGENRSLVSEGMMRLRQAPRVGLVCLALCARRDLSAMSADDLAYSLIPRLNAAGRMDDPAIALDLLLEDDPIRAHELALALEAINQNRRSIEADLTAKATALIEATYQGERVIVVGGEGWHEGVKGIVASRVVGQYHVPALLFNISDGIARGSGRSVGSINLFSMVEKCSDLLIRFGGHAGAVGVTLEASNLDAFRDRMEELLETVPADEFVDTKPIAAMVSLCELDLPTIQSLARLRPFGQGNEVPLLACTGVLMNDRRHRGDSGQHLSFVASDGRARLQAIMFNVRNADVLGDYDGAVDLVFEPKVETWQGRASVKLHVKDILMRDDDAACAPSPGTVAMIDALWDRSEEFLNRSELATLARAQSFHTKVAGVSFDDRQQLARGLSRGQELCLRREPNNAHDPFAIAVLTGDGAHLGYLKRLHAAALAPLIDRGAAYQAHVENLTGLDDPTRTVGVNILVTRISDVSSPEAAALIDGRRHERERLSSMGTEALTTELKRLLIGDHDLLPAQDAALRNLDQGISTLCVMATGRGKSLIFHVHAARTALMSRKASIFVYPLRALVSDQAFHLGEVFDGVGMTTRVLTGETGSNERAEVYAGLADGSVDIVLTTPEFLSIHSAEFASTGRVGFVVIDEAHHAGLAVGGERPAYLEMPRVLDELGGPRVLAVTATATDAVAMQIRKLLRIPDEGVVLDPSVRSNLRIVDERQVSGRDERLVHLLASGAKTLVYVNSREQTVALARMLRHRVWERGHRVAFYNGGLSRSDRAAVEEAFRTGELTMVISTSAFGEGVNLPDVRHVVLYHLPFDEVAFNQMSGRAGRDGGDAWIHLDYAVSDARINERLLAADAPAREELVALYRLLGARDRAARMSGEDSFGATNSDLADECSAAQRASQISDKTVSCGISIFRELGFVKTTGYGAARRISLVPNPDRMDLTRSIRYLEGLRAQEEFARYREWALGDAADLILGRINRPILPHP